LDSWIIVAWIRNGHVIRSDIIQISLNSFSSIYKLISMRNSQELRIDVFGRPTALVAHGPNGHCIYCRDIGGSLKHKYTQRTPLSRFGEVIEE